MNEILKKTDEEIFQNAKMVSFNGMNYVSLNDVRKIILTEQKEHDGCKGCNYEDKRNDEYPCSHCKQCYIDQWKPKEVEIITIGDKIRESNESLADAIKECACDICMYNDNVYYSCENENCRKGILDYLNQPVEREG